MGNDNRVAGKGRGGGHIQRLHWGIFASSHSRGCAAVWTSSSGKAMEHLPSVPLAALISSSLRTEPTTTPQVLTELGFSIPSYPGTPVLGGNGLGKVGWQWQKAPLNPTVLWPHGFLCTQDPVLPPWSGHWDKELRVAGPHFVLQGAFISRDLTQGFKMLPN